MVVDEDRPTDKSRLVWDQGSNSESIEVFLERNPPSKTCRATGGDGWIWVVSKRHKQQDRVEPTAESLRQAKSQLSDLVARHEEIERSSTIPKIKSKTSGPSKKMLKEVASEQCEKALRNIGETKWPCGKWMFFETVDYVDVVFAKLARSIVDGPLSELKYANCHTIKVATADSLRANNDRQGRGPQQLVCLYFDNVWNEKHAKEVLDCIVKQHGEIPNSAKADLYTMIGLDSNHPSKLRSTLYRPSELYNWEQLREWQHDYRQEMLMSKKGAEAPLDGKTPSSSKSNDTRTPKRKYGDDGTRLPVDPDHFWPVEVQRDRDKGETGKATKKAAIERVSPVANDDDDSETEPESDYEPTAKTKLNVQGALQIASAPCESSKSNRTEVRQDQITSIGHHRTSNTPPPPDEKVKKTPQVVLKVRKRDRFGRSDF
jgi:hypothetical protein